jgi:hypothetical protein
MAVDLTYGADVSTFATNDEGDADLDPYFAPIFAADLLREHVLRGWTMQKGEMWDAPDEGYDVRDRVSDRFDQRGQKAFRVKAALELEAENDERIASCAVDITQNLAARKLLIEASVSAVTGETFDLVATIDQVTVELLSPR